MVRSVAPCILLYVQFYMHIYTHIFVLKLYLPYLSLTEVNIYVLTNMISNDRSHKLPFLSIDMVFMST